MKHIYIYELDEKAKLRIRSGQVIGYEKTDEYVFLVFGFLYRNIHRSTLDNFLNNQYLSTKKLSKIDAKKIHHQLLKQKIDHIKTTMQYETDVFNTLIKNHNNRLKKYESMIDDNN